MDDPDPGARPAREPGLGGLFGEAGGVRRSREVLARVVDALLEASPETATALGDHRFDERLDDLSTEGMAQRADVLRDALQALDGVDDVGLDAAGRVDLDVLRGAVAADVWRLEELRAHEHDPRVHLPGPALRPLLGPPDAGDTARPEAVARAQALTARLCGVPYRLAVARGQLHGMARAHVEAAVEAARSDLRLLGAPVDALTAELAARAPGAVHPLDVARAGASAALEEHAGWLEARLADAEADPRLGAQRYAATLWYTLDIETAPDVLLTRAESDLQGVEEELAETAAGLAGGAWRAGGVRQVLEEHRPPRATWRQAVAEALRRVRGGDLVSVPGGLPVPPAPSAGARRRGEGREPLLLVAAHDVAPGMALQRAHAARLPVRAVRRVVGSEVFVQGWAACAEELVAGDDAVLRLHLLRRRLLATIAAVLDVRVHAGHLPRAAALDLLTSRGHLDEPAAAAAYRAVVLAPARASAPYAGHAALRELLVALRAARPGAHPRAVHDAVLAHGAPPPRHLRALLGLPADPTGPDGPAGSGRPA